MSCALALGKERTPVIDEKWVILAAVLNVVGGLAYLVSTFRGVTKPNRVSWLLWGLIPLVAVFAQLSEGVSWPVVTTLAIALSPICIFATSFRHSGSAWRLGKVDYACGGLALLGVVLWQSTSAAGLAIAFSVLADAVAGVPTILKAYKAPETENYPAFAFGAACGLITLLSLNTWDFVHAGFAVYYTLLCLVLVALIWLRPGTRWRPDPTKVQPAPMG